MGRKTKHTFDTVVQAAAEIKKRPAAFKHAVITWEPFKPGTTGKFGVHTVPRGIYTYKQRGNVFVLNKPSKKELAWFADPKDNPGSSFQTILVSVELQNIERITLARLKRAAIKGLERHKAYAEIKFTAAPKNDHYVYI